MGSLRSLAPSSHLLREILACSWMICFSALSAGTFGFSSLWACVSRHIFQPDRLSRWLQLFLCCMPIARQLRFTSSHLCLNLLNSGGRRVSNSVHVDTLLDELNCHSWNLFDDLPSPISGYLKMFSIASHRSSQQAAARAWSFALALGVSYYLLMTSAFGDWSFRKLLVKGSTADPIGVSQATSLHLSECVAASDHGR